MSRPRKLKDGETWEKVTISLPNTEMDEFHRLRGKRTRSEFIILLLQAYKLRRGEYELRRLKNKTAI